MTARTLALLMLVGSASGCAGGINYLGTDGPVRRGALSGPRIEATWRQSLKVVSFNVEYGREVEGAIALFEADPDLAGADVVLLQEMDGEGVERVARALGMAFVYHPATRRGDPPADFGNAVLSRWPIVASGKLILPHRSIFGGTIRTATVATIQVGSTSVRVYSAHLATPVNQSWRDRADQMRAILSDARRHPHVILGGDFNSEGLPRMASDRGYLWPTREGPKTVFFGRVDHILMKGFDLPGGEDDGTARVPDGVSDHRPVWAVGVVR